MADGEQNKWELKSGGYLGEISALCFVHLPSNLSLFPFLLVGSGPQVLLYDVELGKLLNSFHVFEGIRVHGILCSSLDVTYDGLNSTLTSTVVVFGEKRVKLYLLRFYMRLGSQSRSKMCPELLLKHTLPRFTHWVMDAIFLKDCSSSEFEGCKYLAVGLGDNSICLWDISRSTVVMNVRCPERSLLYSMRLWGNNLDSLQVASGTIYNEVIVWKLVSWTQNSLENLKNCHALVANKNQLHDQQYEAMHLSRLAGHEGSIFRLAWSPDGAKLISVSDDRSARIWNISAVMKESFNPTVIDGSGSVGLILFGHSARVWDCYISDLLVVTAGEDCTCRVWGMDGKQLFQIKDHSGRGIWRCIYDPSSSLLITAGFDSSVKVHMLHDGLPKSTIEHNRIVVKESMENIENFTLSIPSLSDQLELLNSKSEYVRCLHFARENTLYVATNNGYLYHVRLSNASDVKWTELARVSEDVPIVCMDLLSIDPCNPCTVVEDWISVGDGKGNVTIVKVVAGVCTPMVSFSFTWSAAMERQLLGIYWCKSLGPSYVFTADPGGILKLWKVHDPLQPGSGRTKPSFEALLTVEFASCFGTRIMCLDAALDEQVLVCGDLRGNLVMFSLSKGLLTTSIASERKHAPVNSFKGAHGISSVTSVIVSTTSFNQVEVRSTGGDGCICYFQYNTDWRSLEFTGMKQVKELSLIRSFSSDSNSDEDLGCGSYAIGFASADFIIWNLLNEIKVVQISCGGWRRPHSYYLGNVPERQNCFAYVKDYAIHIHRLWIPDSEKLIPHVLHLQYHGREIHSLCFVSDVLRSESDESLDFDKFSCLATGCEDGTVRLTRYDPECQNWSASKLLGEHIGGSAVRSICFVSKIYKTAVGGTDMSNTQQRYDSTSSETESPVLLISVGAKRVLTSWLLRKRRSSNNRVGPPVGDIIESGKGFDHSQRELTSVSFQWLSTDMPSKISSTNSRGKNATNMSTVPISKASVAAGNNLESKSCLVDKAENDWRYLAVSAFLVKDADCRLIVCFVVVSCSDATLTLRALILPYRLWFDVALLVPQTAPVLSLQNVILPTCAPSQDNLQVGCVYILISGATDGSIIFWDLTERVEGFMQRLSEIQPENFNDCQVRPRTGRGSQGGRWWRKLHNHSSKLDRECGLGTNGHISPTDWAASVDITSPQIIDAASAPPLEEFVNDLPPDDCEIKPFYILNNVHQSGVNCLHVSTIPDCENPEYVSSYCVLSGGDDQALHSLTFELSQRKTYDGSEMESSDKANCVTDLRNLSKLSLKSENQCCMIKFLSHDRIASAHSSAVKGVWTDGTWGFTVGLDQRVRCWHLMEQGKLCEVAHLVVSVTEPEALDVKACGRNQYQIAVAGRGMQMVMFSASKEEEGQR